MEAQLNARTPAYLIYDTRGYPEKDVVYEAAVNIADEIMEGLNKLTYSNTIETAMLLITGRGAHLILFARSFEKELIDPAFRSTLKNVTYDSETGYIQRYVIPILDVDCSTKFE